MLDREESGHHLRERGDRPSHRGTSRQQDVARVRVDRDERGCRDLRETVRAMLGALRRGAERPDDRCDGERRDECARTHASPPPNGMVVHGTAFGFDPSHGTPPSTIAVGSDDLTDTDRERKL